MLALSDEAMTLLLVLAEPLPKHQRATFLQTVAERVGQEPEIGDGIISRIGRTVQKELLTTPPVRSNGAISRRRYDRSGP
jgi:hypothetical protein